MKKPQHLSLVIPKKTFQEGSLSRTITSSLTIPKRVFPPNFEVKNKDFLCTGYFACYNKRMAPETVAKLCQEGRWSFLASLVGDFLIIYCDFTTNEISILTDQTGKFPCFFSLTKGELITSTNFETVKNALPSLTLNTTASFDLFARAMTISNETVISEIEQIPPGTLLKINNNFSHNLTSLVDLKTFLGQELSAYTSLTNFANDFLALLKQLVAERIQSIGNLKFGSDISSGFDSSIICYLLKNYARPFTCYCGISQYTTGDTSPQIVREFAQRHGLQVKFINEDLFYPLSSKNDLGWAARSPNQIAQELMHNFYSQPAKDGCKIEFTGEGADEVYKAYLMDLLSPFPIQEEYFWTVKKVKLGLERLLTEEGIKILLDRRRFQRKRPFWSILSPSAILLNLGLFPICWETGVWPMTPFTDPRLIQFARRVPRRDSKAILKQEIWKSRQEIFVPSQFRTKQGPVGQVELFLEKKKDFVIAVLEESFLSQKGWVRAPEIISDLKHGDIKKYFEGDTLSFLLALVKLEYFLQQNNVKIPN